jgi:peptide/nickel transport system substrate-binding protein
MGHDVDRREFILGFVVASFGTVASTSGVAIAAGGAVLDQPWAVWAKEARPVRGGYFRIAVEQYIGKMNPNHWPVLDWVSMGYLHEKLMMTDGTYDANVPWLAEQLTWENPQQVLMRRRARRGT